MESLPRKEKKRKEKKRKEKILPIEDFDQWVRPDLGDEGGEFERIFMSEYDVDIKDHPSFISHIVESWQQAELEVLSIDTWKNLENTDSFDIKNGDVDLLGQMMSSPGHMRDWQSIQSGFSTYSSMPCPMIARLSDGRNILISGNTRLCTARVFGVVPRVLFIDFPEYLNKK